MHIIRGVLGIAVLVALAWGISENRRRVSWRFVLGGVLLQLVLGAVLLRIPVFRQGFLWLNHLVLTVDAATGAGTSFVFGFAGGAPLPYTETSPGGSFILAFRSLPLVLVMSALSALFFHWGILQRVVGAFAWGLRKTLHVGGAEGLGVAANIFVGMVEAPLLIRPYINRLSRSELFAVMTSGMATIAGTVMVLYATILKDVIPGVMGHILTASIISAPASVVLARIMLPETGTEKTEGTLSEPTPYEGPMDAIVKGTMQGVELLISIVAMIIVLLAMVYLLNAVLGLLPGFGGKPLSLERILGAVMAPVTWLIGVPWSDAVTAGQLMGTKTVLNELIGYLQLSQLPAEALAPRSKLIMIYAMCGFANPGSLGIMIGGLSTMAPDRRRDIVELGLRSIIAGTLAACMTGAVAGILLP